jgi:multimeric flavodoxin WrbA
MKVVGINGSARKDGNTAAMVRWVFNELEKEGIETELVQLAGKKVAGCAACYQCFVKANRRCAVETDALNDILAKMDQADAVILASPVYFANITSEIKALIDRAGLVSMANGHMFARKVGAAVVAARRGGAIFAFDALNHFLDRKSVV